jgi:RNA polymerase sigma-54 factor
MLQLHLTVSGSENIRVGEFLVGCIDERGYLCVSLEEAQETLKVGPEIVEKVLKAIQTFEPYGVGARDLKECLLIQLRLLNKDMPLAETIINDHLDDLAQGHIKQIAARLGIGIHETQDVCNIIRTLDPKPGRQYGSADEVRYLLPDIIVEKINGEYVVSVNDGQSPHLFLNKFYQDILKAPESYSKDAKKYLEEKLSSALWLIKSIEHRRLTLYHVVSRIVEIQRDFLDYGINYLKPLTLKQVAEKVQVHESTISRAIANKSVQTPQGVFELKYFFSSGVRTMDEEGLVSARSIKSILRELIEGEESANPLSDQQICDTLAGKGINCSRRTVAKYRTELGIPRASARRRY